MPLNQSYEPIESWSCEAGILGMCSCPTRAEPQPLSFSDSVRELRSTAGVTA